MFFDGLNETREMPILNFNLGVLGHVDSGKTTLVKALSSIASTACFDKNPQSKERGITLDLGFSSFSVDLPEHVKDKTSSLYTKLQFTLGNLMLIIFVQYNISSKNHNS